MRDSPKINKGSAGQNRKLSDSYIKKARAKDGVVAMASGLLYRIIEQGSGAFPTLTGEVLVNQRIWGADGRVIADTYKTGLPERFSIKEAIEGLREGLLLMANGSRFEFVVPPDLAWGKRGVDNLIGPNAVLIFDIRLLEVCP